MIQDAVVPARFHNFSHKAGKSDFKLLITDGVFEYFIMVVLWGPGQFITVAGLIVNVLNVVAFVRQGLRDSVTISLFGLTVSDLGSLVFLFFVNLCWTPAIGRLDLPFYPRQMMYFMFYGHVLFTRVTTGTTAWIAVERCLCIVTPLKVKSIITPRRTILYICFLYLINTASVAPLFYTSRFTWTFDSARNKSVLLYGKIDNREKIEGVVYLTNNILPICFFLLIVVCTIILIKTLRKSAKWRKLSTGAKETTSSRDTKVIKLVLIIAIVFIFCYAPGAVFFMWVLLDRDMRIDGRQKNFLIAFFSLLLFLESINATVNFFVYITMNSKFKLAFEQLITVHRKQGSK
ncbi:hypothetical protein BsWGS_18217 [Bradybaena similaris]